jgi:hypothetical protein
VRFRCQKGAELGTLTRVNAMDGPSLAAQGFPDRGGPISPIDPESAKSSESDILERTSTGLFVGR